jgi:hypothetical protein
VEPSLKELSIKGCRWPRPVGQFGDPSWNWSTGLIVFVLYAVIAILFFGCPVLSHPRELYIGSASPDTSLFMWLLVWWPYAITHHINPFITRLIWFPGGYNLAWTHFMFAPAIVGWPLTQFLGPVFSWNILSLTAVTLDAWSAFLLCQYLCQSFWPAFVGGYLFGFSPYVLGHLLAHLPLITVFPLPLAVYLVLLRIDGRISSARFTLLLACDALFQFLCSPEIFATAVVLGSIVIILALWFTPAESRWNLLRVCGLASCAIGIAALLSAPFWYYALAIDYQHAPINSPELYSSDLLGFVIPNPLLLAGRISLLSSISQRFGRNLLECNTYLGLPLIAVLLVFAVANYRHRSAMLVVLALVVAAILSLGSRLHIDGTESIYLPWWFASRLPLINQAMPIRLSIYIFMAAAIIVSMWLAAPGWRIQRWLLVTLGVISLAPNLGFPIWATQVDTPRFFTDGTYKRYIAKNQTVLIVPYGSRGNSMLWQATTGMYFKMAGGNCSYTPAEYKYWPVLRSIFGDGSLPNFKPQLEGFLEAHDVDVIIAAPHAREVSKPFDFFPGQLHRDATHFFAPLGIVPVQAADVLLWRLPKYHELTVDKRGQPAGIGGQVVVSSVSQSGTTITLNGSGFSLLTVINFFNKQGAKVVNLGGLEDGGWLSASFHKYDDVF